MTNTSDMPICELSFHGHWTPLNKIFFSQCIQDSDEERNFYSQRKKWKRKRHGQNKKSYQNYIVYEYVSSESEESTSNESTSDNYEVVAKKKKNQKSKRNLKRSISDKPNVNSSDEYDDPHYERRVEISNDKPCSEPEIHMSDEFNSADEQERNKKKNNSDKPDVNLSDEFNDPHEERIDDDKPCSEPEVSDELNSADEQENNLHPSSSAVKCKKYTTDKNESSDNLEILSNTSNDHYDLSDKENNLHLNQSAVKYKKYAAEKDESSEEWEMHSNTSTDQYDLSDSSDDYEVAAKKKKDKKSKGPQLSEYEKMVQKNRCEKMAFLKSLNVFEAKENYKQAVEAQMSKTDKKEQKNKRHFQNLYNVLMEKVDKTFKTKGNKESEKIHRRSTRQKNLLKMKKENFTSSQSYNELPTVLSFEKALRKGYEYRDFLSEVSSSECKIPRLLDNDYVSHFKKMTLQESQVIPNGPITSMVLHESQEKIIICMGKGKGEIVFWHVNSGYDFSVFKPHLERVSCLKFNPYSPNMLISSSLDGSMYCGNFENKTFYQIFKAECCNHFDFLSPTSYLVAHGNSYVSIVDNRTNRKTFEKRHKCSEDDVKTVSLHPISKNYFISAHQKGSVKLWDLRKLQNEPVIEAHCKEGNLISSSFSPVTGSSVLTTMSNAICLFDSSSLSKKFTLEKSIEHDNYQKGSTPFQATWLPNTDSTFVVGSRLDPRRIEIFDDKLYNFFNFADEHFNVMAAFNAFHSTLPVLASASMRKICIFSESE